MSDVPNDIVLYHYTFSPYARRIVWYLQLRGIPYAQCLQPAILPRLDLEALNVNYRRIPILSIGRDFYCDTRLILRKLDSKFPPGLSSDDPNLKALERLLERWTVDAGIFGRAVQLIPTDLPNMRDPKFHKDREAFSGRIGGWDKEKMEKARPEAVVHIRDAFELMESTLLADGRDWVFKTEKPSMGDIEAVWPFHWLTDMPGALPDTISDRQFPKVFAWLDRFRNAVAQAKESGPKPVTLKGKDVVEYMKTAQLVESSGEIDVNDPLGLKAGDEVEVWPIETGFTHRDRGKLVTLTPNEVVVSKHTRHGNKEIHVHCQRWGFRVAKVEAETSKI
ncbi:hypothetical protein EJ08DRAFT_633215 [Tothia fuscella]|uniref:GST N-terminal domain-containing protein n=1 Tax=Tothia fuscella TaxID=1048955 RepID=A0A9P4TYL7_9PEZI|nr:hypothetical protein EJ08DRAFT_633215 [Tothia fuscella]